MYWTSDDIAQERRRYSERDVRRMYEHSVNKLEYPEFEGWLWDMERSAVLCRHEEVRG